MLRIGIDTCVLAEAIIRKSQPHVAYLRKLLLLHQNGFLQIVITKAVQFEFYAILRAGRLKRRTANKGYTPYFYSHEEAVSIIGHFPQLFDLLLLEEWNARFSFPTKEDVLGIPLYKSDFKEFIRSEYGWQDWGLSFIEERTSKSQKVLRIHDEYDYPIMAAALLTDCHALVTDNLRNFAKPLGPCIVINTEQANSLDYFSEYFELIAMEE